MLVREDFSLIHDEKCKQMLKYIASDSSSSKVVVKFLKTVLLLKSCGCGELHPRDPLT